MSEPTDCRKPTTDGPCCRPDGHIGRCSRCPHHSAPVDPEVMGHCAGPSWAAHEVTEVDEGDACPSCGTVMP